MIEQKYEIADLLTPDMKRLRVPVDFTKDTENFWVEYWEKNPLGKIKTDPDSLSEGLRTSQYLLYCGKMPGLTKGEKPLLMWDGIRLSSDTIITMMNFSNYDVVKSMANDPRFRPKVEKFMRTIYTIGGEILFPRRPFNSINQVRGSSANDRFDVTLMCIQKYYGWGEVPQDKVPESLLQAIKNESEFFNRFGTFKNYVDTFFLNDLVDEDYNTKLWIENPKRPKADEYETFMQRQMEFLEKRNRRISEYELPEIRPFPQD